MYCRIKEARNRIVRVTPADLTSKQQFDEISLFSALHAMPQDDPLRHQLIGQKDVTLRDAYLSFMCTDRDASAASTTESANAATVVRCHHCDEVGHFAKDCPFFDQFKQLVARHKSGQGQGNHNRYNRNRRGRGAANAATAGNGNHAFGDIDGHSHETAGVSLSLSRHLSSANDWMCDSGATCTMTSDHSAFSSLLPDRRPVRLADGRTIYSDGIGSIRFLSSCDFVITINDVLFVPSLASSLFSPNRFARDHRATHSEVTEYLIRKWVNRQMGAVEFTATIASNDLAYLDWKPIHSNESANVTITELHARLNHMPFPSVRQLLRNKSIAGIPSHVTISDVSDFCEDCVNGKLTRAPHGI